MNTVIGLPIRVGAAKCLLHISFFDFFMFAAPYLFVYLILPFFFVSGMMYLKVTTDPIELWASPASRSRVEKDFFDSNFRPFYRTSQVSTSD
jgi:hypothetical protein